MTKFCSNCGNQTNENDEFCSTCGSKVRKSAPKVSYAPNQQYQAWKIYLELKILNLIH